MTIERSTDKATMEAFSTGVVLTTMVFITTAGDGPTLTIDLRLG